MSELPQINRDDLTEGWPAEPDNEELAQFAGMLQGNRPALSEEALGRLRAVVEQELVRRKRRRRRRLGLVAVGLAAGVLALLLLGWHLLVPPAHQTPPNPGPVTQADHPPVRDRYEVEYAPPPAAPPLDRPLLPLEDNQSLFSD